MAILKHIVAKLFSGKWIFTLACAVAFLFCVWKRILPPTDIKEIIMIVLVFYFGKASNEPTRPDNRQV